MGFRTPSYPKKDIVIRRYFVVVVYNNRKENGVDMATSNLLVAEDGSKALAYTLQRLRKDGQILGPIDVWFQDVVAAEDLYTTEGDIEQYEKKGIHHV